MTSNNYELYVPQLMSMYKMFLSTDIADYSQLTASYPKDQSLFTIDDMIDKIKSSAEIYYSIGETSTNKVINNLNITHAYPNGTYLQEPPILFVNFRDLAIPDKVNSGE